MTNKITVILADDHPVVRAGIKSLIKENESIEIVSEASNGQEALDQVKLYNPNLLITDISMPKLSGIEVAAIVTQNHPETRVLVLSMHMEAEYIMKGFNAGIMGYLPKDSDQAELFEAIETIHAGEKYLTKQVSSVLAQSMVRGKKLSDADDQDLTSREKDILKMLVNGLRNKEIAVEYSISIRTVDTHRTNIMRKLKVNNTAELVKKAISQQLI